MNELELMRHFGEKLDEMLDYCNMTQKELAEESGISESTISCYIRGDRMPTLKSIINIMWALDCEFDELIDVYEKIK